MAALPARRRACYRDVLDAAPNKIAQVIDGVLHVHSRPAFPHAQAASVLGSELGGPFHRGRGGPGGWILLDEPELHLGTEPDIVVPDLAGWRRHRLPRTPRAAFLSLAPDWVCEVVSPSTEDVDRAEKLPVYAREKVGHAWLVDPLVRTLEVFRLDGETYRLLRAWRGEAVVRAEPFDAIELELGALWADLEPEA
ncbi:MAG: Uma2 family endonuclease [Deltaproteobacteria bacterium]|nr:Uma2 family endonuclease [Deltaproteobacteria bacterium]